MHRCLHETHAVHHDHDHHDRCGVHSPRTISPSHYVKPLRAQATTTALRVVLGVTEVSAVANYLDAHPAAGPLYDAFVMDKI